MSTIGEILAKNRKKKGLSQPELVSLLSQEGINVTTKAVSKWETNAREPGLHVFLTLCRLLDVEDIYASYFGENPYNAMDGLNEEGKDKVRDYIDILKASKMFEPVKCKIIEFRRKMVIYRDCVSAGTGNYLTDSLKETYEVGEVAPETADFGVRISGDSMEPDYHNGEIAWIQHTETINNGEIGIFYHNGDAYIKKLHDEPDGIFLISLNQKYKPIPIIETDSFKILGRVVGSCDSSDIPGLR